MIYLVRLLNGLTGLLRWLIIASVTLLYYFAVQSNIYNFPSPRPFSGKHWFNPYSEVNGSTPFYKANFHAHSKAYGGTTNGEQSTEAVMQAYKAMGYSIVAVSDYFKPHPERSEPGFLVLSAYEHGINVFKTHRNVIGSQEPVRYDIPLNLTRSNKQYVLNRLRESAKVLAVNHPRFMDGHTTEDLKYLTGYDNLEVLNHFRNSSAYWDSALSAGRPVRLISNDDTHNITNPNETGVNLTLIYSSRLSPEATYTALKYGTTIGVVTQGGIIDTLFNSLTVTGDTLLLKLNTEADSILGIGQFGKTKVKAESTTSLRYILQPEDAYLRLVVYKSGREYYFNPVLRYPGGEVPYNTAAYTENSLFTALYRIGLTVLWGLLSVFVYYLFRRQNKH